MENNKPIMVYTAQSRKQNTLKATPMSVQELFSRLGQSQTLPVSHKAYMALKKAQQDEMKDIGAYIAGELKDGKRRRGCVISRSAAVLDADNLPAGGTDDFLRAVAGLGMCCCVHSTAKHSPESPRLRVVVPFSQNIPAEQYSPVVRLLCRLIQPDMTWFDPTTAESGRIMYWASHCEDVIPVYTIYNGAGFLDASAFLAQQLPSWQDFSTWPCFPREQAPERPAAKQQDPAEKAGLVGAFCRAYDVPAAMEKFLPGVYEETDIEGRYTFTGGSTTGGAVLYDSGKFLYSHHATDPAGGKLVNAWDLVRLHRFGELDDEAGEGTKGNRLPSYQAMCDLANADEAVREEKAREAVKDFRDVVDEEAVQELGRHAGESFSLDILRAELRAMGIHVRRNLITRKLEFTGISNRYSKEEAVNTIPVLLWDALKPLKIKGGSLDVISKSLAVLADENRYNPVLDMLRTVQWDGMQRFPELLDVLGIEAGDFYALLVRKWLIQCIALVHNTCQGIQEAAEGVLTLQGEQGIGKTMLFRKLAIKSEWFAEGVTLDMKNKDSIIQATGVWIAELGELESTLRKEQTSLKAFITQKVDRIRAPYAAEATEQNRHTSFGATVNPERFLKDDTGDRRFWVVPVTNLDLDKLLQLSPSWFTQLWAEVYTWWQQDSQGFRLSRTEREHLNELNQRYRETLPGEEEIRQLLDFSLPVEKWKTFSASQFNKLFLYGEHFTGPQVGRVLTMLQREDKRIANTMLDGCRRYRLPIRFPTPPQGC